MAPARGSGVSVVKERNTSGRVGSQAAALLSQGREAARDPFMNSVSLIVNSNRHDINMRHATYIQEHDAYVELIVEAKQAGTDRSKKN